MICAAKQIQLQSNNTLYETDHFKTRLGELNIQLAILDNLLHHTIETASKKLLDGTEAINAFYKNSILVKKTCSQLIEMLLESAQKLMNIRFFMNKAIKQRFDELRYLSFQPLSDFEATLYFACR